jgi:hypothetical protein
MEHFIALIDSIAWPATILVMFYMLRKPIKSLLPFVENVKYKDLEVTFRKGLQEARTEAGEAGIDFKSSSEEKENIYRLAETSPSYAIVEAWKEIELAAKDKINQLVKNKETLSEAQQDPLSHLELTGALIPSTIRAIRELWALRNQTIHIEDLKLSKEDVLEYVILAKAISKQINSITELPKQKLQLLTLLILEFNRLLDSGKYNHITIKDIHREIKNNNIIEYLRKETAGDSGFSMFTEKGPYYDYLDHYHEQMYQLYECCAGNERRKWGVEKLGLCLLVAWTNELIQGGSGWHPYE